MRQSFRLLSSCGHVKRRMTGPDFLIYRKTPMPTEGPNYVFRIWVRLGRFAGKGTYLRFDNVGTLIAVALCFCANRHKLN
jgi:hypothetical protein